MELYKDGICHSCLSKSINNYLQSDDNRQKISKLSKLMGIALSEMLMTPANISAGLQDIGLLTGYCIMGTGPISTIASSITDLLGAKSNAYFEKSKNG